MSLPRWTATSEGATRQPTFFTHGPQGAILCIGCGHRVMEEGTLADASTLEARYYTDRLLMCGGCNTYIGPADESEKVAP